MYFYLIGIDYKSAAIGAREAVYRKRKELNEFLFCRVKDQERLSNVEGSDFFTKEIDDALVSRGNLKLAELPKNSRVGLSSVRRNSQIQKLRKIAQG